MRLITWCFVAGLSLLAGPGIAQTPGSVATVDYQDGMLSVTFAQTPAAAAFEAIRAKTGLRVVLPGDVLGKALTARIEGVVLEEAVRRLLRALGLESFALVYEPDGQAGRLVLLESAPGRPAPGPAAVPPAAVAERTEKKEVVERPPVSEADLARGREITEQSMETLLRMVTQPRPARSGAEPGPALDIVR